MREKESERGNKSDEWQQLGEGMKKAYPLCHLGKERVFGGRGPLEISKGGSCNNKEDKGMVTERYLRPLAGAKGCQRTPASVQR